MKKTLIIFLLTLLCTTLVQGQGEIDDQLRVMLRDESTFAGFLNSNGFGANYRYGYWRNYKNQFLLDFDFSYVKHPKEIKTYVSYNYNTYKYVYGKENLFWELKGMAGWQKELYRKIDRSGISVRMYYAGGLALGFTKPIYYKVFYASAIGEVVNYEYEKFDPSIHQQNIGGRGPFFMGFSEIGIIPGITGKTGFSFEYSHKDAIVHALEAGITLTLYPKKIPIMGIEENNFFFLSLNVGYRFGRIIDISQQGRSRSRKQKREDRKEAGPAFALPGV